MIPDPRVFRRKNPRRMRFAIRFLEFQSVICADFWNLTNL